MSQFTKGSLIRQALTDTRVVSVDAVVIGDRATDIMGAKDNGAHSIGVTWGYGERDELGEANHIVDSWPELVACLQRAA